MNRPLSSITIALFELATSSLALSQSSMEAWVRRYHDIGSAETLPIAVAVTSQGTVVIAAAATDNFGFDDILVLAYSSSGELLWTARHNSPVEYTSATPTAIAADANGNVYVTGRDSNLDLNDDFLTIKYSPEGVRLWAVSYNGSGGGNDGANCLAIDDAGNVIVAGDSVGTEGLSSHLDCVVIKYSPDGQVTWINRYNGPAKNADIATDLAVDRRGRVFVTGYSYDDSGRADYLTHAYAADGAPLWTRTYNGPSAISDDYARALAVDADGKVFVTGDSGTGGNSSIPEYTTICYSPEGERLWVRRYHADELVFGRQNFAQDIAVDAGGNVFVTGGAGGFQSVEGGYATLKYSNSGEPMWTRTYNGPVIAYGHTDDARSLAIDADGNVILTGHSYAENPLGDMGDIATVAYSNEGTPLWVSRYNGPGNGDDVPLNKHSLVLGPDGSVYVVAASDGDPTEAKAMELTLIKYTPTAAPAPTLEIQPSGDSIILSWKAEIGTRQLQRNTGLDPLSWSTLVAPIKDDGSRLSVTVPVVGPEAFFRLVPP